MALFEIGSAAAEAAVDASRRGDTVVPQRSLLPGDTPDHLLDAVRRGLAPDDPVARLLAGWAPTAVPAVVIPRRRSATARTGPAATT